MKSNTFICRFLLLAQITAASAFAGQTYNLAQFGDRSGSLANAAAACNKAANGDVILFPPGKWTWSSSLVITKCLTIAGDNTTLVAGSPLNDGFLYITGFQSTNLMRITGFSFDLVDLRGTAIKILNSDVALSNLRIDSNSFCHGSVQIEVGGAKGVIDNNIFSNGFSAIYFTAGSRAQADASWGSMEAGSSDALFIEDNLFLIDKGFLGSQQNNQCIDTYNGGKLVVRYNRFISTNPPPTATDTFNVGQLHGSAAAGSPYGYWQKEPGTRRGQSVFELYGNVIKAKRVDRLWTLRGSASLIYNNVLDTEAYNPRVIAYEEESYETQWSPNRTEWPAEDQVHNTFLWNNVLRLRDIPNTNYFEVIDTSKNFIKEGRDYWLHAPKASGGYEYFTGDNGASGSYPTDGTTYPTRGTMVFTNVGPNAYYGYTPYTYPHPLRNVGSSIVHSVVVTKSGPGCSSLGMESPATGYVAQGGSTQIVYTAADWGRVLAVSSNGVALPVSATKVYTQVLANVSGGVSNAVVFAWATAEQTGYTNVPIDWLTNWAEHAIVADPAFSVGQKYMLGLDPTTTNTYVLRFESVQVAGSQVVAVVRREYSGGLAPGGMNGWLVLQASGALGAPFTNVGAAMLTGEGVFDGTGRRYWTNGVGGAGGQFFRGVVQP